MAKAVGPSSSSPPQPSSYVSVFMDTNLDTRLVMVVSPDDRVADLKGKIKTEHALCFPNIGEVSVEALKVKRRATYYQLSDSMPVENAFSGIKGTWFLYVDLVPATSTVKRQTETGRLIMSVSTGQPQKHNLLKSDCNASLLPVDGVDVNQDFVINGLSTERGLIQTSISNMHEDQTLPDTLLQKPLVQGNPLAANVNSPQTQDLRVSSSGMIDSELSRRSDAGVSEMELITEDDAVVGSHSHQKNGQGTDQGHKDEKGGDHENVDAEADVDVSVAANKKEKSRKRNVALQNDQFSDGKLEHPHVEKKRRKKEKDRPLKEPVKDQLAGHNLETGVSSKEISLLEIVLPGKSFEEKHESNLVSSEEFPSKPSHVDSSLQQNPTDVKHKKKKKKNKHLLRNDEAPQEELFDNSLCKPDATLRKQATEENRVEGSNLGKESDAADPIEVSTQKVLDGNSAEVDMLDPSSTDLKQSNYATERLFEGKTTSTDFPIQEVSIDNPEGPLGENTRGLSKEFNAAGICNEAERPSDKFEKDASNKQDSRGASIKPVNEDRIDETYQNSRDKISTIAGVAMTDADMANAVATKSGISSEISAKSSQHSRTKKQEKTELPKTQPDAHETVNPPIDQVPEENQNKTSSTHQEHSGKEFKGTDVSGDADATGNSAVTTFPSSPSDRKQKRRKRKSEKIELHHQEPNLKSTSLEANSSIDQVPEENQNKTSSTHQEHSGKEFKGTDVSGDADATGNSAVTTFPSSPSDRKQKRRKRKSEKIELHHQEPNLKSTSLEANSSRDQVTERFSKEKSSAHLEHPGTESNGVAVLGDVENSRVVQSVVPSNPNDKKSRRTRKKSEKTELPSGRSIRAEPVHSLVDEVTKRNLKESREEDQNEASGNHLRHPSKESEGAAVEEATVVANAATVDSTVPLNPSDKKSKRIRKKSGKSELPGKESSRDEAIHSLVKEAPKENAGETLNDGGAGMGGNSKLETILREAPPLESATELDSVTNASAEGRSSSHRRKKNARTGLIDHSSSNYDLDKSLASEHTHVNLEKGSGTTRKISGSESKASINSDETGQNMDNAKPSNLDSTGFNDSSDKHEIGRLSVDKAAEDNTMGLEKAREESAVETVQETMHKGSTKEARDHRGLTKSDGGKIDFIKFFDPKENRLEPGQELPSLDTETKSINKEKSKRKKKLNPSPQNSILLKSSVSDEQHILQKKPQDNDSGNHNLVDTSIQIAKELTSRKKHEKKDANKTHRSGVHLSNASDLGYPRRSHDDDRPGKKIQDYGPDKALQGSLSKAEWNKHPNEKTTTSSGSKVQSRTHHECNDNMVSASSVPKHRNFDASVSSSPGGAPVTQNTSNAVTNDRVEEDTADLVASSDSTEEDTPSLRRFRVAVRKVPQNRYGKGPNKFNEEMISLSPTTIFNDATTGSSDDEFQISNRQASIKATSDNSSTSTDSDGEIEETQISYKNSPGAKSTGYHKGDKGTSDARNNLIQSSTTKRKGKPLSTILKSTSSYKKAKLIASQSEVEDSESQDVIPETQPELGFL